MHFQDGAAKLAIVNRAKIIWLLAIDWVLLFSSIRRNCLLPELKTVEPGVTSFATTTEIALKC
jgi:hypothetical protein